MDEDMELTMLFPEQTFQSPTAACATASPSTKDDEGMCPIRWNTNSSNHGSKPTSRRRELSITDLDKLQRQRREESRRRISNINDRFISESLADFNAKTSTANAITATDLTRATSRTRNASFLQQGRKNARSRSRSFGNRASGNRRGLPRLKLRPQKRREVDPSLDEPAVIIQPRTEDGTRMLRDLIPSPHSNRFVLLFPDNPAQELALSDEDDDVDVDVDRLQKRELEEGAHQGMFMDMDTDTDEEADAENAQLLYAAMEAAASEELHALQQNHQHQQRNPKTLTPCGPTTPMKTFGSNNIDINFPEINNSFNTPISFSSGAPLRRRGGGRYKNHIKKKKKKKILLQPKPRECNGFDFVDSPTNSCSSTHSSLDLVTSHSPQVPSLRNKTVSLVSEDKPAEPLSASTSSLPSAFNVQEASTSASRMLTLKPKKVLFRKTSIDFSKLDRPSKPLQQNANEIDVVMDLKRPSSRPSLFRKNSQPPTQPCNLYLEAFTPSPPRRKNSSVQDQIEMAKEAAARFGSGRNCNSFAQVLSPSEMSESNFRTPVAAPKKGWFHIREQELNSNISRNTNGSNSVGGLFLPGLFASTSEDEMSRYSKSGSIIDFVKGALSPA